MIASGYRKCYSSLGISLKLARELSIIMDDERVIGITLGSLMLVYLLARLATELRWVPQQAANCFSGVRLVY